MRCYKLVCWCWRAQAAVVNASSKHAAEIATSHQPAMQIQMELPSSSRFANW
jgi:hypothetical protein